jgi:hypothetical protein
MVGGSPACTLLSGQRNKVCTAAGNWVAAHGQALNRWLQVMAGVASSCKCAASELRVVVALELFLVIFSGLLLWS